VRRTNKFYLLQFFTLHTYFLSGEFTAKPGACPTAHGLYPGSEDCEWDMDCPGWQKCCRGTDRSLCSDPAS
uniref:WAP domain-containing protein n=1 Tax=Mola mola TaxID=94237 RepID=A0A3Q3W6X1_MOLML